jgi:hypothetical protein
LSAVTVRDQVVVDVSNFDAIVDATASSSVWETLLRAELTRPRLIRCEMTDQGSLGYLLAEGPGRLPRVDDLQVELYGLGLEYPVVGNWLGRHRDTNFGGRTLALQDIGIGISCGSDTMKLPNDIVFLSRELVCDGDQGIIECAVKGWSHSVE